jgi:hypothetical protein
VLAVQETAVWKEISPVPSSGDFGNRQCLTPSVRRKVQENKITVFWNYTINVLGWWKKYRWVWMKEHKQHTVERNAVRVEFFCTEDGGSRLLRNSGTLYRTPVRYTALSAVKCRKTTNLAVKAVRTPKRGHYLQFHEKIRQVNFSETQKRIWRKF